MKARRVHYSAGVRPDVNPADSTGQPRVARQGWIGYAGATALCAGAALLATPLASALDTTSIALLFMLAVVLSAARFGRGPALLAAGLSVLLLNLLFVPPRFSLAVADERFVFTFLVMLAVGLVVGQLTAGLRAQAQAAGEREQRVRSLYEVSRELGGALTVDQVAEAVQRFASAQLDSAATLWIVNHEDRLRTVGAPAASGLQPLAQEVAQRDRPAGRGTAEHADLPVLLLPLRATMAVRGVLAVQARANGDWSADQRRSLTTCATLLAGALERIHYSDVAQATALEVEGERLRNTLLAAISHDLRTPLASLVGLADSLRLTRPPPSTQQAEIADAIAASARRMGAMTNNLLDMARLQSGQVRLDLQWQPLEEVVGAALAAASGVLGRREVEVALAADLPWLHIDAVLMERVLVNLLENAVKFTPVGTPIEIRGVALADEVELTVQDHGPGLPPGREEDLFKKFERGERESATTGVGLGLALCRAIVVAHGGSIHAQSLASGGSRFVMRLRRGRPPSAPPVEEPPHGPSP